MWFRNEVHNDAIRAFYLAPYKIFKVPSNSVRRFCFLLETFPCKRELSFLNHPHLQGWLRSNKSKCSIWEFWLWSLSKHCSRWTMILIGISRIIFGFMNIAVWWNTLIFISLSMVSLQNIGVRVTLVGPLSVWSLWTIWSLWSGVCLLPRWCHEDIHRKLLKSTFGHPDLLQRWSIPAVSTNKPGKHFTIMILKQLITCVKRFINDNGISTSEAREGRWIH